MSTERWRHLETSRVVAASGLVVVVGVAYLVRSGDLGVPSLWLDDAWQALAVRVSNPLDAMQISLTASGFALLLWSVFQLLPFSETGAQLLALGFGLAAPLLLFVVLRRVGARRWAALAASGIVALAPMHIVYSTRVKQYTLDAVLTIAIVAAGFRVLEQGTWRRWLTLAVMSVVAILASSATATVAAGVSLVACLRQLTGRRPLLPAVVSVAIVAAFAGVWWAAYLSGRSSPDLVAFWRDYFVRSDSIRHLAQDSVTAARRVAGGLFATRLAWAPVGIAAGGLVFAKRWRWESAMLAAPLAVAWTLAVLSVAPIGGGRIDLYLYPLLAMLVGLGLDAALRFRGREAAAVGIVVATVVAGAVLLDLPASPYPREDVHPLVEILDQQRQPGDRTFVYWWSSYPYALYTPDPVVLRRVPESPGFVVDIPTGDTVVLGRYRDDPERYRPQIMAALQGVDRAWLIASHWSDDLGTIYAAFEASGSACVRKWERPGAALWLWERAPESVSGGGTACR